MSLEYGAEHEMPSTTLPADARRYDSVGACGTSAAHALFASAHAGVVKLGLSTRGPPHAVSFESSSGSSS